MWLPPSEEIKAEIGAKNADVSTKSLEDIYRGMGPRKSDAFCRTHGTIS